MEDLSGKIQKLNLLPEEVISSECLTIELIFLDYDLDSFYAKKTDGDVDFIVTKNKINILLPNS